MYIKYISYEYTCIIVIIYNSNMEVCAMIAYHHHHHYRYSLNQLISYNYYKCIHMRLVKSPI